MTDDRSEADLRDALRARVDAAPEPPPAMFARTLDGIGRQPRPHGVARWKTATRWWSALAAPARFALAAIIVVAGGTIAFGTSKARHELALNARTQATSTITLDRLPAPAAPQIARSGVMLLVVHDVPATLHRIALLARHERGSIVRLRDGSPMSSRSEARVQISLRVPEYRLDATLKAIATFGSLRALNIHSIDIAAALRENARRLHDARRTAAAAPPGHDRSLRAVIDRLNAQRAKLQERIAYATIALTVHGDSAKRVVLAPRHWRQV